MNIALIGYGKMGREIEQTAIQRGHRVVLAINSANLHQLTAENLQQADVAIEFTHPEAAFANVLFCIGAGVPVVCGSTGWYAKKQEAEQACLKNHTAMLVTSNFSIGVNIFFEINRRLSQLMNTQPGYEVGITEIHHTAKKDAPSGTAITLAEQVLEQVQRKKTWVNHKTDTPEELGIVSERIDPAPGTHIINWNSMADSIEITHTAHNRSGFALGAVLAAEFIAGKQGIFTMKDVLGIG